MGFEQALCTSPLGGGGLVRGNRRVEKTGVTDEGETLTMTCVSRSLPVLPVRERCWISSLPLCTTRSVQTATEGRWIGESPRCACVSVCEHLLIQSCFSFK